MLANTSARASRCPWLSRTRACSSGWSASFHLSIITSVWMKYTPHRRLWARARKKRGQKEGKTKKKVDGTLRHGLRAQCTGSRTWRKTGGLTFLQFRVQRLKLEIRTEINMTVSKNKWRHVTAWTDSSFFFLFNWLFVYHHVLFTSLLIATWSLRARALPAISIPNTCRDQKWPNSPAPG